MKKQRNMGLRLSRPGPTPQLSLVRGEPVDFGRRARAAQRHAVLLNTPFVLLICRAQQNCHLSCSMYVVHEFEVFFAVACYSEPGLSATSDLLIWRFEHI